jgi:dienelactone hydrolase
MSAYEGGLRRTVIGAAVARVSGRRWRWLMQKLARRLGPHATLLFLQDADHSWHVPARSGRADTDTMQEALDALVSWIGTVI